MRALPALLSLVLVILAADCKQLGLAPNEPDPEQVKLEPEERRIVPRVRVQHILIAFDGARIAGVTRTKAEAEKLAAKVMRDVQHGRPFEGVRRLHTDDSQGPQVYSITNWGVEPGLDEMARDSLAPGFSDMAFSLEVGRVALVPYDADRSPWGFHIVKRLK